MEVASFGLWDREMAAYWPGSFFAFFIKTWKIYPAILTSHLGTVTHIKEISNREQEDNKVTPLNCLYILRYNIRIQTLQGEIWRVYPHLQVQDYKARIARSHPRTASLPSWGLGLYRFLICSSLQPRPWQSTRSSFPTHSSCHVELQVLPMIPLPPIQHWYQLQWQHTVC